MQIQKPETRSYKAISLWASTHQLFKRIAEHYQVSMTVLLDQIARNIIEINGIGEDKEVENSDEN